MPRRDIEPTVAVQRFDFVVFDVVAPLLVPVLDAEGKAAGVLFRLADKESAPGIGVGHQVFFGSAAADLTAEPSGTMDFGTIKSYRYQSEGNVFSMGSINLSPYSQSRIRMFGTEKKGLTCKRFESHLQYMLKNERIF